MLGYSHAQDTWAEVEAGGGLSGQTLLATPFGMTPASQLRVGDYLRSVVGGPVQIVAARSLPNLGWLRIPTLALGNRQPETVARGQNLAVESCTLARLVGGAGVVMPAAAMRYWRGISPCAPPPRSVRLILSRPALVVGASGILFAINGPANFSLEQQDLPPLPSLSLASAQQLVACMIAHEAGAMMRRLPR
jgi:hypothetical protein